MTNNNKKACTPPPDGPTSSREGRMIITGPVLDRLIKEKMTRTPECDGVEAMPVVPARDGVRGANWKIPGFTGDLQRVPRAEAAIRDYVDFLSTQFDLPRG